MYLTQLMCAILAKVETQNDANSVLIKFRLEFEWECAKLIFALEHCSFSTVILRKCTYTYLSQTTLVSRSRSIKPALRETYEVKTQWVKFINELTDTDTDCLHKTCSLLLYLCVYRMERIPERTLKKLTFALPSLNGPFIPCLIMLAKRKLLLPTDTSCNF